MPTHPARARQLLRRGKAAVFRRSPFTIILKDRSEGYTQPIVQKVDPGSKESGIALVGEFKRGPRCVWAGTLVHRGQQVKLSLEKRRGIRRSRRSRKTRYRPPRFQNRRRRKGWLPPSLESRVANLIVWVKRISHICPLTSLSLEWVRFDTQAMQNPEISGIEYQQGELYGYQVREYLLAKWKWKCVYCQKKDVPLEVEHIIPKSRGGSDRVSNLTLACRRCNLKKGAKTAQEFGHPRMMEQAKHSLRDAAALNATRFVILESLKEFGLSIELGDGAQTKYNRTKQGYQKEHWLDAVCVGESGRQVYVPKSMDAITIKAMGRGTRQMCRVDRYGFPRTASKKLRRVHGFQTGDLVEAVVLKGKKKGQYVGRVAVRSNGFFNITTSQGTVQGIGWRWCQLLQREDGYQYY